MPSLANWSSWTEDSCWVENRCWISQRFYLSMCDLLTDVVLLCRVYAFGMAKDSDLGFPAFFGLEVVHAKIFTFGFIINHSCHPSSLSVLKNARLSVVEFAPQLGRCLWVCPFVFLSTLGSLLTWCTYSGMEWETLTGSIPNCVCCLGDLSTWFCLSRCRSCTR